MTRKRLSRISRWAVVYAGVPLAASVSKLSAIHPYVRSSTRILFQHRSVNICLFVMSSFRLYGLNNTGSNARHTVFYEMKKTCRAGLHLFKVQLSETKHLRVLRSIEGVGAGSNLAAFFVSRRLPSLGLAGRRKSSTSCPGTTHNSPSGNRALIPYPPNTPGT